MSDKIGRNDLCFCGSGKKYKKCCLGKEIPKHLLRKEHDILPPRREINFGVPRVDEDFFEQHEPLDVSAGLMSYVALASPQMVEDVAKEVCLETDRNLREIDDIKMLDTAEKFLKFLKNNPDRLNHLLIVEKFLQYKVDAVILILEELHKNDDDFFVEWAIKLLYLSGENITEAVIDIIEKYQREAYVVSQLCLLLGFYDHPKITKILWDYFFYFKVRLPNESYSEAPLLALYEMDSRHQGRKPGQIFVWRKHWDEEDVAVLSDEEIIERLKGFGVPFDKEIFLEEISRHCSADTLSEEWLEKYPVTAVDRDEDFLWYACMELWKRLAPDLMFDERLTEMVDKGYDLLDDNKDIEACQLWLLIWEHFKIRYAGHFRSIEEADEEEHGGQDWQLWCQDLEVHLGNVMRRDPVYTAKTIKYAQEFRELLPESSPLIIQNMMMAEADALMIQGNIHAGDEIFQQVIDRFPKDVWGYIRWGDVYAPNMNFRAGIADPVKAERIYRMALGKGLREEKEVKYRIKDIESKRRSILNFSNEM